MGEEGLELLGVEVSFLANSQPDELLEQFGDPHMIAEMKRVFFRDDAQNSLGHSYARLICGPEGRHDLQDVISMLRTEPLTKRALVTLSNPGGPKVPCVNVVQFLVRGQAVQTMYFARGQDAFRKFYADGICLAIMTETVAAGLAVPAGSVRGFIGSSHLYHSDKRAIQETLTRARAYLASHQRQEVLT